MGPWIQVLELQAFLWSAEHDSIFHRTLRKFALPKHSIARKRLVSIYLRLQSMFLKHYKSPKNRYFDLWKCLRNPEIKTFFKILYIDFLLFQKQIIKILSELDSSFSGCIEYYVKESLRTLLWRRELCSTFLKKSGNHLETFLEQLSQMW